MSQLSGASVLIVEDDAASAKLLAVLLRGEGATTRCADSAEEALRCLEGSLPDVIVIDIVLPMMSGLSLAELLKVRSSTRHIPLIAVSAFNGPAAERAALGAGCAQFLQKPIDPLVFTQIVTTHLKGQP